LYVLTYFTADFDIVPLNVYLDHEWSWVYGHDRCQWVIVNVDKHEIMFRILNSGLFSFWYVCLHDQLSQADALPEFYFTWLVFCLSISTFSLHVECM